ncbi:AraC family transcriptional regulator [Sphingomonas zeicaulis]|uniref:helix-turn-helix domain-containing protein n=1 Tax=Sphingomonas zeicaulis TaxID=1632740 RepID=UPI003D22C4CF
MFSPLSLDCASAKPNHLIASSRDLAWRGLLLDHHRGLGKSDVFETHATGDVTLVVATRGRSMIQVFKQGRWHTALYESGNAGLTRPGETTRMSWQALDADNRFETAHLYLSSAIIGEVAEEYRRIGTRYSDQPLSALVLRDPTVAALAVEILGAMHEQMPGIYEEQATRFLAAHLLARHAGWWEPESDRRAPEAFGDRQLARVLDYMSSHFGEELTLAALAREACISVHHFVRRFRERLGMTPFAYLTTIRIEAARRMLRTTDLTVAEIGRHCGYTSAGSFSSAFHRQVGATPRIYRAEARIRSDRH